MIKLLLNSIPSDSDNFMHVIEFSNVSILGFAWKQQQLSSQSCLGQLSLLLNIQEISGTRSYLLYLFHKKKKIVWYRANAESWQRRTNVSN